MEYITKSFYDIKDINSDMIIFKDESTIEFDECTGKKYNVDTCVADRDITVMPAFFEFFTDYQKTRVVFDKKGLRSKQKNRDNFIKLQIKLQELGYSTYDIS